MYFYIYINIYNIYLDIACLSVSFRAMPWQIRVHTDRDLSIIICHICVYCQISSKLRCIYFHKYKNRDNAKDIKPVSKDVYVKIKGIDRNYQIKGNCLKNAYIERGSAVQ